MMTPFPKKKKKIFLLSKMMDHIFKVSDVRFSKILLTLQSFIFVLILYQCSDHLCIYDTIVVDTRDIQIK